MLLSVPLSKLQLIAQFLRCFMDEDSVLYGLALHEYGTDDPLTLLATLRALFSHSDCTSEHNLGVASWEGQFPYAHLTLNARTYTINSTQGVSRSVFTARGPCQSSLYNAYGTYCPESHY